MVLKKGKRSLYKKLEEKGDHFQVHFFIFQKLSASANKIILLFFFLFQTSTFYCWIHDQKAFIILNLY